ncbi:MAG TPA: DUF1573 domain-containing protein [Flavipsychrobacter sp.]|nr:DUF1573 domain-containing protein [Flavipsychrobacter sp.]
MKKVLFSIGLILCGAGITMAQQKHATANVSAAPATSLTASNMAFSTESHDFGTVPEGPAAQYDFKFKNTGNEPIILQKVQPSCGCTTPSYSKDPILPGKEGIIKVSYNTQGRPNAFTKTITVVSNAGTRVLTIKGTVEKAPTSSVPENNSMIKTN